MYLRHYLQANCKLFYYLLIQLCIFHIGSLNKKTFLLKSLVWLRQKHVLQNHLC